jgi:hypothetical protein
MVQRMCKINHITPKYIHVKVNGNNLGCINAKQAAKWGGGGNLMNNYIKFMWNVI